MFAVDILLIFYSRYLGQIISLASRSYLTNCRNHVKTNFSIRMTKFIQHHLEQIPIIKKHMNTYSLANILYTSLVDGADTLNLSLTVYDGFLRKKDHINPLSQDDVDMVTILYLEFRGFVGDVDLSEKSLGDEKKWHLYLPL